VHYDVLLLPLLLLCELQGMYRLINYRVIVRSFVSRTVPTSVFCIRGKGQRSAPCALSSEGQITADEAGSERQTTSR
jgi:hypothetical protein